MFETVHYCAEDGIATVTLNRPGRLTAIVPPMPDGFKAAIEFATRDRSGRPSGPGPSLQLGIVCRQSISGSGG